MKFLPYARSLSLFTLVGTLAFMSGCSADMNFPDSQGTAELGAVKGAVWGGQQPITGAHVFLFETPTSAGYANTVPVSLLGNAGSTTLSCAPGVALPLVYVAANSTNGTPAECYYQTTGYNGTGVVNTALGPNSAGEFNLSHLYSCDIGQNVWMYSISGYPDTASPLDLNPYASLMADLGPCVSGNFSADTYIYMNELSTVAMAYSVAGFTADAVSNSTTGTAIRISAPSTNTLGITNAFANAQQLYSIFGVADHQPDLSAPITTTYGTKNGFTPYQLVNTLGDYLAACINSTGNASTISTNCSTLFTDVYGTSSIITDTASAMIHIAKNPNTANPTNLLTLAAADPVWNPYYTSAPPDLSASIAYTGISSPAGMVLDGLGNAYTNSYAASGYMAQLTPLGVVSTTLGASTPIKEAAALTVDSNGLIWTAGDQTGALYNVSNTTSLTSSSAVTLFKPIHTLSSPGQIPDPLPDASDRNGYVYIADSGNSQIYVTTATAPLTAITSTTTGHGCITGITDVAVDNSGDLWTSGTGSYGVCRLSYSPATGAASIQAYYKLNTTTTPKITEVDALAVGLNSASVWVVDSTHNDLYNILNSSGTTPHATGPFTTGGISDPINLTVDGTGNVWVLNYSASSSDTTQGSISEFTSGGTAISGSPTGDLGFQYQNLIQPQGIGVDISGNVWVANYGGNTVLEVIGIGTPTSALNSPSPYGPGTKP